LEEIHIRMGKIAILTVPQKDSLIGELVCPDVYFNPIQDINLEWFISEDEINTSIYTQHEWIKSLPLVDYPTEL